MAELVVITGPPGAGKTTVAALVARRFGNAVLIPGDVFFGFRAGGVPPWLPEAHAQNQVALRAAGAATGTFVAAGDTVVYDGVLGPWFLPEFMAAAQVHRLHYAVLLPSLDACLERVAGRSGHGFDDPSATRRMHGEFTAARIETRHVVTSPGEPPETAGTVLERLRAGTLLHRLT